MKKPLTYIKINNLNIDLENLRNMNSTNKAYDTLLQMFLSLMTMYFPYYIFHYT